MSKPIILRFLTSGEKTVEQSFDKIGERSGHLGGKLGALGKIAGAALGSIVVAAAGVGLMSLKMADKYEIAHSHLEVALKASHTSWEKQKGAVDAVTKSGEKLGFTMSDTEEALAVMTRGTGSSSKALKYLGLAQDLSRAKNIALSDAALLVTKASEGQIKPLKALGLDLPFAAAGAVKLAKAHDAIAAAQKAYLIVQAKVHDGLIKGPAAYLALTAAQGKVSKAQHAYNVIAQTGGGILDALSAKLKGSAASAAETFAGKMKALKAKFDDIGVHIGLFLIPMLDKLLGGFDVFSAWVSAHWPAVKKALLPVLHNMATFMQRVVDKITKLVIPALKKFGDYVHTGTKYLSKHNELLTATAIAITPVVAGWTALLIISKVTQGVKAAQDAWIFLNVIMLENPAVLIALAIGALGAAFYLCYLKIKPFHEAVDTAWQLLQTGFDWVKSHWLLLVEIIAGPIGLAAKLIVDHFASIKSGCEHVFASIVNVFENLPTRVGHAIGDVLLFFIQLPFKILGYLPDLVSAMVRIGVGMARALLPLIGQMISNGVGFIAGLPGKIIALIPAIAKAGVAVGKGLISALIAGIKGAASLELTIGKAVANATIGILNGLIDKINQALVFTISLPFGKKFHVDPPDIPHIPKFANGVIVTGPTLGMIGEAGPEMVLPLSASRRGRARELIEKAGLGGAQSSRRESSSSTHNEFTIIASDPYAAMRAATREAAWAAKTSGH